MLPALNLGNLGRRLIQRLLPLVLFAAAGVTLAAEAQPPGAVSVADGKQLLRDCRPWVPTGLSFYGRLIPSRWDSDPDTLQARDSFGQANMDLVRQFGGDAVRYQIGMPFLDPKSHQYRPDYLDEVAAAVQLARRDGFVVFLSMQWQGRTRVRAVETMPGASALRAWQAIAPRFSRDQGVVFELFNEPASVTRPDPQTWELWRAGHQAIIDALRSQGVPNVLLVEGINGGRLLDGAPDLKDPLGQLIYGVHPYMRPDLSNAAGWNRYFGDFARRHVVVATEWSHFDRMCGNASPGAVQQLLDYLSRSGIGMLAYGAESPDSRLVSRDAQGRIDLTTFEGRACEAPNAGPGQDLKSMFTRLGQAYRSAPVAAACHRPSP
ncbi:cellulase family glycosylhydrolase [Ideonella oryzae]|uniref:Glycoside hydrolase family 5 protein n=1 Tax=Ideonella oryzae TaxID=2937441 RepID=A0ABT1BLQ0_9BURK|nr:cellulase family glycosylhydrolase [Ideonella oryzae]MCO5977131.1 glycoside hydrolase family 5 protein [Ideonella oryzae]